MRYLFFVLVQLLLGYGLWRSVRRHSREDKPLSTFFALLLLLLPILSVGALIYSQVTEGRAPELIVDLLIFEIYLACLYPLFDWATKHRYQRVTLALCLALLIPMMIRGRRNVTEPVVTYYDVALPRVEGLDSLRIALVTDIHLGDLFEEHEHLGKLAKMIKEVDPAYVLIGGDLIDHDIRDVDTEVAARYFAEMGGDDGRLFFILGNHEYYGDVEANVRWIESMGPLLRDSVLELHPGLFLIGREYYSSRNDQVPPLSTLTDPLPEGAVKILLQHRPHEHWEKDPKVSGVDLALAGHTHAGQIFPMQIFQPILFEDNYGRRQRGETTFIISSGYGASTSRLRIGSRSEIVVLDLHFGQKVGQ